MKLNRTSAFLSAAAVAATGLLLSMPAWAQEAAAEEPAKSGTSFLSVVFGGTAMDLIVWLMIFLTSLATLALIIDSCVCIRAVKIMPADLIETVKNSLAEGDLGAAMEACVLDHGLHTARKFRHRLRSIINLIIIRSRRHSYGTW